MSTAYLLPITTTTAVELSNTLWRKQILPREQIHTVDKVTGQPVTLDLNDSYYQDLINSFKAGAFDQVAFQLASSVKNHDENPERFRGEALDFEITPTGLDAILRLTEDGSKVVRDNPKLGVSVSVVEDLVRGDGKRFPRALKHIAGLLDPAATGMSPWKEVALGNEGTDATIDLSKEVYGMTVPNGGVTPPVPAGEGATPPTPPATVPPVVDTSTEDADAQAWLAATSQADLARQNAETDRIQRLEAELAALRFDRGAQQLENDGVPSSLVQLARDRVGQLEMQLARQRFENEAFGYIEAGVPPAMLEIARPLLELPLAPVVELSRDGVADRIDTGVIVRRLLQEAKGLLQLNRELGSTIGRDMQDARDEELLKRWEAQT